MILMNKSMMQIEIITVGWDCSLHPADHTAVQNAAVWEWDLRFVDTEGRHTLGCGQEGTLGDGEVSPLSS